MPSTEAKELLDVVHPLTGEPTGEIRDKAFIHRNGLWHGDVHLWVTNGLELLEQKRADNKSIMPGKWDISVGEHVKAGEPYEKAVCRGAKEELGLDITPEQLIAATGLPMELPMQQGTWIHRVVCRNFVVLQPQLQSDALSDQIQFQRSEITAVRLYDIDQLEADLADPATDDRHAEHPHELWEIGIAAMRAAAA